MTTLFSTEPFARAWTTCFRKDSTVLGLSWDESRGPSTAHGIVSPLPDGTTTAEFGPAGLYAAPDPFLPRPASIRRVVRQAMKQHRISHLTWYVRFNHHALAAALTGAGFESVPHFTHVVALGGSHAEIFSRYRKTRRNEIRQSQRKGCVIRKATTYADVEEYCRVHETLALQKKDFKLKYPAALLFAFVQMGDSTTLLLAEVENRVVAGSLFFKDGDSMFYWHGAANREFSDYFPTGALVDSGIQLALSLSLKTFDFGASNSEPLRDFKGSFGATAAQNWTFTVKPPYPLRLRVSLAVRRLVPFLRRDRGLVPPASSLLHECPS